MAAYELSETQRQVIRGSLSMVEEISEHEEHADERADEFLRLVALALGGAR